MGGTLSKPNRIKDVYTKIVFYDGNKLKYDNGTTDVVINEVDNFSGDIVGGTGITTTTSNGTTTISVTDAEVLLQTEDINGGVF
jgi:phage baseplate assembly protein gpV|tara:strand:- start:19 stop:270 length:252 start_codon:yes stop_codon:yes gene_type:complete